MRVRFPTACLCVLLVAGAAAAGLLRALEGARPPVAAEGEAPWLPPAGAVRPLFLGYSALAADLFWFRTVQYFGGHIQTDRRYPHLYRLVDLTTSLDPHFVDAYQLGGLFLSLGRAYSEAIAIYRKGIEHNPDRWELPHDLGRLYFLELYDYPQALQWWELTDRLPGRPHYIPRFVARLHAQTGQVETAIELWTKVYTGTTNEWIRGMARKEIEKLRKQLRTG